MGEEGDGMSEEIRQKWIGVVMDLMVLHWHALDTIAQEWNDAETPEEVLRPICDRVADAVGSGATGDDVYQFLVRRIAQYADRSA